MVVCLPPGQHATPSLCSSNSTDAFYNSPSFPPHPTPSCSQLRRQAVIKVSHKMPNFTKKQDLKVSAGLDIDWPVNTKNPNPVSLDSSRMFCVALWALQRCIGEGREGRRGWGGARWHRTRKGWGAAGPTLDLNIEWLI